MPLRCCALFLIVLALVGCNRPPGPASTSVVLTPAEFTAGYAEAVRHAAPDVTITIVADLELTVKRADGRESTSYLHNAYDSYKQDPTVRDEVIQRYVKALLETAVGTDEPVDMARIVPVVKDRAWIDEVAAALDKQGAKEPLTYAMDSLNDDLVVLYAQDSEANIRYLSEKDLQEAKVDRAGLRALALENLKTLLPEARRYGADGFYLVAAGGTYESSLILFHDMWKDPGLAVKGDPVFAIPTRDVIMVTGSDDVAGLARMRELVQKVTETGTYRLTTQLFVLHEGQLLRFAAPEP